MPGDIGNDWPFVLIERKPCYRRLRPRCRRTCPWCCLATTRSRSWKRQFLRWRRPSRRPGFACSRCWWTTAPATAPPPSSTACRARGLPITRGQVAVNRGQGLGLLTGFRLCHGRAIGYVCADGQVAPEDVVRVYRALQAAVVPVLAKARRRGRTDGWVRRMVSGLQPAHAGAVPRPARARRQWQSENDAGGSPSSDGAVLARLVSGSGSGAQGKAAGAARHRGRCPRAAAAGRCSHVRLATVGEFVRNILAYRLAHGWCRSLAVWRRH